MAYFTLELQDSVYVLTMINGDKGNVMDDAWLDELTLNCQQALNRTPD